MAFKGIEKAALLIAADNGGINRGRTKKEQKDALYVFLAGWSDEIKACDEWLKGLSDEDLETVCQGEKTEADAILADAPPLTSDLLKRYFEEVC